MQVPPSTLQLWLETVQSVIGSLAYPVAIVIVFWMFKKQLARLFDRITSGEGEVPGGSFKFEMAEAAFEATEFTEEIEEEVSVLKRKVEEAEQKIAGAGQWEEDVDFKDFLESLDDNLERLDSSAAKYRFKLSSTLYELEGGLGTLLSEIYEMSLESPDAEGFGFPEIADYTQADGPIGEYIAVLTNKGYVERSEDTRYGVAYSITDKGRRKVIQRRRLEEVNRRAYREFFDSLESDKRTGQNKK